MNGHKSNNHNDTLMEKQFYLRDLLNNNYVDKSLNWLKK